MHTGSGGAPDEYVDFELCQLYSCTPSELDEQDMERVLSHVICLDMKNKSMALKSKKSAGGGTVTKNTFTGKVTHV